MEKFKILIIEAEISEKKVAGFVGRILVCISGFLTCWNASFRKTLAWLTMAGFGRRD